MILRDKEYQFEFDTNGCKECNGRCCRGSSGYIWLNNQEMINISTFLKIEIDEFKKFYLNKVNYKFSIKEKKLSDSDYACLFFENNHCLIYDVRPKQCRTFPFWDYFKDKTNEVLEECPATKIL